MHILKIIPTFLLLLSICLLTSCGKDQVNPPPDVVADAPLADLIATLATRPGVTDPADAAALRAVAKTGASAFRDSLTDSTALQQFVDALPSILQTFQVAYVAAEQSTDVVEAKATATDQLFRSLLEAAEQSGISTEQFEMALLLAFADLQPQLATSPLTAGFSDEDRELVNLLLMTTVTQVHQRLVLGTGAAVVAVLDADQTVVAHYEETVSILDASLLAALSSLEQAISDPLILSDKSQLIQQQFNVQAMNDLLLLRYSLELFLDSSGMDLPHIIDRMKTVGGVMAELTLEDLLVSGVASERIVDTPSGPATEPFWSLSEYVVYDWVRPEMALSYQPVAELADVLIQLGGTVPAAPNFTFFGDPYLAAFQLRYDFNLCNQIAAMEWNQAGDPDNFILPSMHEHLTLRQTQASRRQMLLARFTGATELQKQTIAAIWSPLR